MSPQHRRKVHRARLSKSKRVVLVLAVAIGILPFIPGVAFAHHPVLTSSSAVCNQTTGNYDITWSVGNSESGAGRIMELTASNRAVVPTGVFYNPSEVKTYTESVTGNVSGSSDSYTLTVTGRWAYTNPDTLDTKSFTVTVTEDCAPDLTIEKTASDTTPNAGQQFTYTVTVKNDGSLPATDVVITDDLHDGFTSVSATYDINPGDAGVDGNCSVAAGNVVTCTVGTVAASDGNSGGTENDTVAVKITATAPATCGAIPNTATVDSAETAPVSASRSVTVGSCTNLSITKSVSDPTPDVGQQFTYTILVTNTGDADATGVVVTDDLPDGFTVVSAVGDPGNAGAFNCSVGAGNAVTCANNVTVEDAQGGDDDEFVVRIVVTSPSCGSFPNTAAVGWTQNTGSALTSNSVDVTVSGCQPNIDITKTAAVQNGQVAPNTQFTYSVAVSNTGNGAASGVVITDSLPAALTSPSATFSVDGGPSQACSFGGNDMTCTVGALGAGTVVVVTISVTSPDDCVAIDNTAAVDWTGSPSPNHDQASASVAVTGCASLLSIEKTGAGSVTANGSITWTITVTNGGNADAPGVLVTDHLPAGFTFVPPASPDVCSESGGTVTCNLGTVARHGGQASVQITATAPDDCGPFTNSASVWQEGGQQLAGSASATGEVTGCAPNLTLDKDPNDQTAAPGGQVTWSITVTNSGNADAPGVVVSDQLPAGFTFVPPATPDVCSESGGTVTCNLGTVARHGGQASVQITATAPDDCGPFTNSASIDGATTLAATAEVTIEGCAPNLTLDKDPNDQTAAPGGQVTWSITVTNSGNADAPGVVVSDQLPAGFTFVPPATPDVCSESGGTVTCNLGTVASHGGQASVQITATAPDTCDTFTNSASIDGATAPSATADVSVEGCAPALDIEKGPDGQTVGSNGTITWTISVTNTGSAEAHGVVVTDQLPAGFTFVPPASPDVCTESSGTVSCNLGSIAQGGSASLAISATAPDACGPFVNASSVWLGDAQEPADSDSAGGEVTGCAPGVTLSKSGPGQVAAGDSLTYTLTVTNGGNADATDVQIHDSVPSPLTNVIASTTQGSCSVVGNDVDCSIGTLSPGANATITIDGDVPEDSCATIQNQATGTAGAEATDSFQSGIVQTVIDDCGSPPPPTTTPGLTVFKAADSAIVEPGEAIGFTISVRSTGTATVLLARLDDTIPAVPGLTWAIDGGTNPSLCTLVDNTLHCNIGNMPPGATYDVHVGSTQTSTASCGSYTNVAVAQAQNVPPQQGQAHVEVDCPPGINIVKDGPANAHVGDTVTYSFAVSLVQGSDPLSNVVITDPICDPGSLSGPAGDDGDGLLEQGETWSYSCSHLVTPDDPDPLPNTATACSGTVCDSDGHVVDILRPAIRIVKVADPQSGSPGQVITYTYTVTNTGEESLFDISVDDDVTGHICDIPELAPGDTTTCSGTFTIPRSADTSITNVGTATGRDESGEEVSDDDDETIVIVGGITLTPTPTTTVSPPGGVAFTGPAMLIPLAGLALMLLMAGTGLLWMGRRLPRRADRP